MLYAAKKLVQDLIRKMGYDIRKFQRNTIGISPFTDMSIFLEHEKRPMIFDVGANHGQSLKKFKALFPKSRIHSFEPGEKAFDFLSDVAKGYSDINVNNYGLGSKTGEQIFYENTHSDMSSFLDIGSDGWGRIQQQKRLKIETIDDYCDQKGIDAIHILKSDTQGYDFEVIKGARGMMSQNRVYLVYFEFIYSDMYQKLPRIDEVFRYMYDSNFLLVNFYDSNMANRVLSWNDMMFINRDFYEKTQAKCVS